MDDSVTTPWGPLTVVRASRDYAPAILHLRDDLATWMVQRGVDQWRPGEMPLAWIEQCAAHGWLFAVFRDGNLIASVTLAWADQLVWGDQDEDAGYIHMLMVDRAYAGNGLGCSLLDWAEGRIRGSGPRLARLDCVRSNTGLREYYEGAGYRLVGYRDFAATPSAVLGNTTVPETALYEKTLTD